MLCLGTLGKLKTLLRDRGLRLIGQEPRERRTEERGCTGEGAPLPTGERQAAETWACRGFRLRGWMSSWQAQGRRLPRACMPKRRVRPASQRCQMGYGRSGLHKARTTRKEGQGPGFFPVQQERLWLPSHPEPSLKGKVQNTPVEPREMAFLAQRTHPRVEGDQLSQSRRGHEVPILLQCHLLQNLSHLPHLACRGALHHTDGTHRGQRPGFLSAAYCSS